MMGCMDVAIGAKGVMVHARCVTAVAECRTRSPSRARHLNKAPISPIDAGETRT
jgi:hypothetical protein